MWKIRFPEDGSTQDGDKSQQLLRLSDDDVYPEPNNIGVNEEGGCEEEDTEDTAAETEIDSGLDETEHFPIVLACCGVCPLLVLTLDSNTRQSTFQLLFLLVLEGEISYTL